MSEIPVLPMYKCSNSVNFDKSEISDILLLCIVNSLKFDKFFIGEKSVILFLVVSKEASFFKFEMLDISVILLS